MHDRTDERGDGRLGHKDHGWNGGPGHHAQGQGHDEPVFTTMAVGEEGDPDLHPYPVQLPEEPVFTTMAVGEEGEPDPQLGAVGLPEEPVFTTLAVGEEGGPEPDDPWYA